MLLHVKCCMELPVHVAKWITHVGAMCGRASRTLGAGFKALSGCICSLLKNYL